MLQRRCKSKLVEEEEQLESIALEEIIFQGFMYQADKRGSGFARRQFLVSTKNNVFEVDRKVFDKAVSEQTILSVKRKINASFCEVRFDRKDEAAENSDLLFPFRISFFLGGKTENFFLVAEDSFEAWQQVLRSISIQTNFDERFSIGEKIGRGSTSVVFQITDVKSGENFAAKRLKKAKLLADEESQASLIKEISVHRELNGHPNVVRLEEVFETESYVFLVLELVRGGKAFQAPFQPNSCELRKILTEMFSALMHFERHEIIHRDFKPDNLLIDRSESSACRTLKVIDFGLATRDDEDYVFKRCGTIGYVAPEVLNASETFQAFTPAVDLFSVGVMLFNHVTRTKAFTGKSKSQTLLNNKMGFFDFGHAGFQNAPASRKLTSPRPNSSTDAFGCRRAAQTSPSFAARVFEGGCDAKRRLPLQLFE